MLLEWSGAKRGSLHVYRDGTLLDTVANYGAYIDRTPKASGPSVRYRVCEAESGHCSRTLKLQLGK